MSTTVNGSNGASVQQDEHAGTGYAFGRIPRALRNMAAALQQARHTKDEAEHEADAAEVEAHEARVELEGEQIRVDPLARRRGSFPTAVTVAVFVTLLDVVPAWWAAEALGGGVVETTIVTVLLVAALAGLAALMSHFKHDGHEAGFAAARALAALLVVVETGLRFVYELVTSNAGLLQAALEAGLLAIVTAGLMWVSYVILLRAESIAIWKHRTEVEHLEAKALASRTLAGHAAAHYRNQARALGHVDRNRPERPNELERTVRAELEAAKIEEEQ